MHSSAQNFPGSRLRLRLRMMAVLIGALFLLVACDPPEVRVEVAPEFSGAAIQVDFVRVPRENVDTWMALDVDAYFTPGSPVRAAAVQRGDVYSLYYNVPNRPFRGRIPANDPVWSRHPFVRRRTDQTFDIFVIVDLPGVGGGSEGDVRIRRIPLIRRLWTLPLRGLGQIVISVGSSGIQLSPAPRGDEGAVAGRPTSAWGQDAPDIPEPDEDEEEEGESERTFAPSELDSPLRALSQKVPELSTTHGLRRMSGEVRAVLLIDESGAVSVLEIQSATHSEAIEPVREAFSQWRFAPPMKDGRPVRVRAVQPMAYDFQ